LLRHWGHCLGLTDNMAGSIAYPVDSLRSKEFVKQHGLSASVMDKLPMNYLLSDDSYSEGMPLVQSVLGVYDDWVIRYLYQPMKKTTPQEELPGLQSLISERNHNPLLLFKGPQNRKAYYDPRGMERDLGNDAIRSAIIACENIAKVIKNANQWLDNEDVDYELRAVLYGHIIKQVNEYMKHVLQQVGGIYLNDSYYGDVYPSFQSVPKEVQRQSFLWMLDAIEKMTWMDDKELLNHCALTGSVADYSQKFLGNLVLVQLSNIWLSESKSNDPYTQQQAISDLISFLFKEARMGKSSAEFKRFMQGQFLNAVISWSDVSPVKEKGSSSGSSSFAIGETNSHWGMEPIESISYLSVPARAHFWYGCLMDLKQEYTKAKAIAPTKKLRTDYDYRLFMIEKALKK